MEGNDTKQDEISAKFLTNKKERNARRSQGKLISLRGLKKRKKTKSDVFFKDVGDFFVEEWG